MKRKFINFKTEQIIQGNLEMPSIQKVLKDEFKIFNSYYSTITSDKFLKNYKNWPISRKDCFCKTIGGKVFFRKVKEMLENMSNKGEPHERAI